MTEINCTPALTGESACDFPAFCGSVFAKKYVAKFFTFNLNRLQVGLCSLNQHSSQIVSSN